MSIDKRFNWGPYASEQDLNSKTQWLSDKTKQEIYSILDNETSGLGRSDLIEQVLLQDLEKNHVRVEENKEMFWYKWKCVYVNLPAIWNFRWCNFNFFESDVCIYEDEFDKNPKLAEASFSKTEIANFLKNFREYMKERWIEFDSNVDFDNLKVNMYSDSYTWSCLEDFTGLRCTYYLNNKNVTKQKWNFKLRAPRGGFSWSCYHTKAWLLLKISN